MTNYTNLTGNMTVDITSQIGSGLENLFGDPLILGIVGLVIIVALGYTMRLDIDTQILSGLSMIFILMGSYLPEWIYWLTLLPIGIYAGVIFSRIIHK